MRVSLELMEDKGQWDRFIDGSPYGMLFHKWDFLRIVEKHTAYKLFPYGIFHGKELICVVPLFYAKRSGLRTVFSPPPQTCVPYLGLVMSPLYDSLKQRKRERYLDMLAEGILMEIARMSPNYVSLSMVSGFSDVRPFIWNGYNADITYTYVMGLDRTLDEIWDSFDSDCKRSIKACSKHSPAMEQVYETDTFYDIMKERFAQRGLNCPLISRAYLKDIMDTFPDNVKMYFLYNGQDIASIALNCEYKSRLMFWMGEINLQKEIAGNEYLKWESIRRARSENFKEVELEGASIKQLCFFKSKFNPSLRYSFILSKKDLVGSMAEWAYLNFIMRKVPLL